MSEPLTTYDTDIIEWSDSEAAHHAERRTRLLFYVFSWLTVGAIFLLVIWMILAEMTRAPLH